MNPNGSEQSALGPVITAYLELHRTRGPQLATEGSVQFRRAPIAFRATLAGPVLSLSNFAGPAGLKQSRCRQLIGHNGMPSGAPR